MQTFYEKKYCDFLIVFTSKSPFLGSGGSKSMTFTNLLCTFASPSTDPLRVRPFCVAAAAASSAIVSFASVAANAGVGGVTTSEEASAPARDGDASADEDAAAESDEATDED